MQGQFKLGAAIAAQAVEDIARQALRVNADQGRRTMRYIAHLEDHSLFQAVFVTAFESVDSKVPKPGWKVRLGSLVQPERGRSLHESLPTVVTRLLCFYYNDVRASVADSSLVTLLVKLGVVASLASILVRWSAVKRMLMRENRTMAQRVKLSLWFSGVFGASVATRVVSAAYQAGSYQAVDLGLEGGLLAGLLGGYVTGLTSGILISIPAMLHREYLTMPLLAGLGVLGGLLRDCAVDPEDIWRFSPFFDLNLWRFFRQRRFDRRNAFNLLFFVVILFAEFLRQALGQAFGARGRIFYLHPEQPNFLMYAAVYATTLFSVTLPIKIWNNTRNEGKLEEQKRHLIQARLEALTSQINPHFLFNTLNSVSSLIRTDPNQARIMVLKLSNILRRLLRKHDNFSALREEISFIDDYLAIEVVRFGDKLRFEKEVAADTLDMLVPSMLLQPLIENCVKHGLSSKVEGGTIRLRSWRVDSRLMLWVEDDGVGIPESKLATLREQGIGVSNVSERLNVLFGNDHKMSIDSQPGHGTRIEIEIPELQTSLVAAS
jgi:two-component system LytT family sensor kinase